MTFVLLLAVACAANAQESKQVLSAREELEHVQWLVKTGSLPPVKIAEAQQSLQDAMDEDVLDRTLYGHIAVEEFTEQQTSEMVAAAQRRVDRQQEKVDRINKIIAADLAPPGARVELERELGVREVALKAANGQAELMAKIAGMAHAEAEVGITGLLEEKTPGDRLIEPKELKALTLAFENKFSEPFPVSAKGMTGVHRALGFDHTGRVDVALNPDSPEGIWLREYLNDRAIPYYAFRAAIAGKATAPHIHIGPGSTRL